MRTPMVELWNRLFGQLRSRRSHTYALEQSLRTALARRARHEKRPNTEVQVEALAAGLEQMQTSDWLMDCWDSLSPREQEVAALTCLNYTNQQMAPFAWRGMCRSAQTPGSCASAGKAIPKAAMPPRLTAT